MSNNLAVLEPYLAGPLQTPEQIRAFTDAVVALVRDPSFPTFEIPFRLAPVVAANPNVSEPFFAAIASIGGHLSITGFIDALLDAGHNDILLRSLPSMGAIDPDNITVIDRIAARLTSRSGPFLFAYAKGWPQNLHWSQAFERMALALPAGQLSDILTLIAEHVRPESWSTRFFSAVLAKHGTAALSALASTKNRTAYSACCLNASEICSQLHTDSNAALRPDGLLSVLVGDTGFSIQPTQAHQTVLRAISDLSDSESAGALLVAFFATVKADRGVFPNETAVARFSRTIPSPEQAHTILQNWCVTDIMPITFTGELLAHLLSCAPPESFSVLFWRVYQSTRSSNMRQTMLTLLAHTNPHGFAHFYLRNRNKIHTDLYERNSPEAKELYRVCTQHLSFLDRLLMMFGFV